MRTVYFLFYFFYLVGAQFPLFVLLAIRNLENNNLFLYMFMGSMVVLVVFLAGVKFRIRANHKPKSNITVRTSNLANQTMTEFLSYFLLPFFTFNIYAAHSIPQQVIELTFILFLLAIFLYRSENLLINPLLFIFFNLYKGTSPGNEYIVVMPKHRNAIMDEILDKENFIRMTGRIVMCCNNKYDLGYVHKFLNWSLIVMIAFIILCLGVILGVPQMVL